MKAEDVLKAVNFIQAEKGLDRELIFSSIEKAIQHALLKKWESDRKAEQQRDQERRMRGQKTVMPTSKPNSELAEGELPSEELDLFIPPIEVSISRENGEIVAVLNHKTVETGELGRIAAQSAKQLIIQNFRQAESEELYQKFASRRGDLVLGVIKRIDRRRENDRGVATVQLDNEKNLEAILPPSEQIRGETHNPNDRIKAVILDVKRESNRVKIVLSRTHPDLVRRLFEEEIPEVADHVIEIRAVSREAGNRAKVAVSSSDMKVDCVGACVGVRGSRIKNIVEELHGERIDIVRWNDSLQVLIRYALQPAQILDVHCYPRLGRAIVLVDDENLSLAIGKKGQNVRLATKLVGWDIEIMTDEELQKSLNKAELWFRQIPGITDELIEAFITEGCFSYEDITVLKAEDIATLSGNVLTEEEADDILEYAEQYAEMMETATAEEEEQEAQAAEEAQAAAAEDMDSLFEGSDEEAAPAENPAEEPSSDTKTTLDDLLGSDEPPQGHEPGHDPENRS
jgi:N utilization substance protein A